MLWGSVLPEAGKGKAYKSISGTGRNERHSGTDPDAFFDATKRRKGVKKKNIVTADGGE